MYARVTSYRTDPSRESEVMAMIDDVAARVRAIPGVVAVYTSWRSADGAGVTMAIYESQEAAEAAASAAQEIWGSLAEVMTAPPDPQVYENVRDMMA